MFPALFCLSMHTVTQLQVTDKLGLLKPCVWLMLLTTSVQLFYLRMVTMQTSQADSRLDNFEDLFNQSFW